MQEHHKVWLKAHPNRSKEWFKERLKDGFDIHHMDGNHENNDPLNLVLIEHEDHNRLHGFPDSLSRIRVVDIKEQKRKERLARNEKRGSFHVRNVKGREYWYFRDNMTGKQIYVGASKPDIDAVIRTYSQSSKMGEDWLRLLDGLRVLSATFTVNAS